MLSCHARSGPARKMNGEARMGRLVQVVVGVALASGAALLSVASALGASNSDDFRILRYRPQWTSSDCIGEPRTPLCAVETSYACWLRLDSQMCRMIGRDIDWEINREPRSGSRGSRAIFYRIRNRVEIERSDFDTLGKATAERVEPGDIAVRMLVFHCAGSLTCTGTRAGSPTGLMRDCPPTHCVFGGYPTLRDHLHQRPTIFVARQTAQNWIVIDAPEGGFQFPDSFWN